MTASKIVAAAASGAGGDPLDIDNVFNTYLWDGDSSSGNEITGIDTLNEGGLVWLKHRSGSNSFGHAFYDTERGNTKQLRGDNNSAESTESRFTGFLDNGFSLSGDTELDYANNKYVAWTFRKAKNFFDIVTWTGDGVSNRSISHNLGSTPGAIFMKRRNSTENWYVGCWNGMTHSNGWKLNESDAVSTYGYFGTTAPTATTFNVANFNGANANGSTYVAYIFAHHNNNGTFGPDGDQDVIKFGSGTTPSSAADFEINVGFEPQFLMYKLQGSGNWYIHDTMRSLHHDNSSQPTLFANQAYYETQITSNNHVEPTATGFRLTENAVNQALGANAPFIYMAIRRGPLAVPEDATKVFDVNSYSGNSNSNVYNTGFNVDMNINTQTSGSPRYLLSRLTNKYLETNTTTIDGAGPSTVFNSESNVINLNQSWWASTNDVISYSWRRAPGYFDVVTYKGTGSNRTISHNLGVAPEMMWVKGRDVVEDWNVYHSATGNQAYLKLNENNQAVTSNTNRWNSTTPTASVFTLGTTDGVNKNNKNYIAYLFATVAGVSKVGSYTGNGTGQNIDCGFSSGARFVLIKKTGGSEGWKVHDSVRGIVAGNDPFIELNNANAENSSFDLVDPYSSGFAVTTFNGWNENGYTYIFYAIA